ncbi:unnamed protein product [Cyclocybe aegerita]|uniref:Uncharacterized protein n=1 Tax=Cyclocybe aegerita TaxID=1973307 RepID=A0A8S0WF23_CYCAE|nr:unnamed protein product [Cyclocybe aegerita]
MSLGGSFSRSLPLIEDLFGLLSLEDHDSGPLYTAAAVEDQDIFDCLMSGDMERYQKLFQQRCPNDNPALPLFAKENLFLFPTVTASPPPSPDGSDISFARYQAEVAHILSADPPFDAATTVHFSETGELVSGARSSSEPSSSDWYESEEMSDSLFSGRLTPIENSDDETDSDYIVEESESAESVAHHQIGAKGAPLSGTSILTSATLATLSAAVISIAPEPVLLRKMAPSDRLRPVKKIIKKETYWKVVFKTGYPKILHYCNNRLSVLAPFGHAGHPPLKDFHRADVLRRHKRSGEHGKNFRQAFRDISSGLHLLLEFDTEYFVELSELD